MPESQGAEAFVEVNDPHVAVRMRRLAGLGTPNARLMNDAGLAVSAARVKYQKRPRLSQSDTHRAAYFELLNLEDSNAVADKLKAKLIDLGYKLTTERFPV